ncbi:hypothetical protein [Roseibium album]|uniref:hypothetical protein n=1 Tax=Roseibium album TaxID=311410 RepID=UPI00391D40FA
MVLRGGCQFGARGPRFFVFLRLTARLFETPVMFLSREVTFVEGHLAIRSDFDNDPATVFFCGFHVVPALEICPGIEHDDVGPAVVFEGVAAFGDGLVLELPELIVA